MCRPGKPLPDTPTAGEMLRFLRHVQHTGDCWQWMGMRDPHGYGAMKWRGRKVWAHRLAYAFFRGELIARMQVHHTCFNTSCVNPAHLVLMSHQQNAGIKSREAA